MKRLNFFLVGIAALGMAFFSSCGDTTTNAVPVITFDNASPVAAVGGEVTLNGEIVAEAKLDEVKIFVVVGSDETQFGSAITSFSSTEINTDDDLNYVFHLNVTGLTEDCKIKIEATDKDNQTATKSIDVTVGGALTDNGSKELGASGSDLGSYYSVSTNTVYTSSAVTGNENVVDFVYNSDGSTATFKSPKNSSKASVAATGRTTLYEKANTIDFATATSTDIDGVTPTNENVDVVLNDVIVFKTNDNLNGIFKVTSLTVATDGTVTIGIKVKQ
jgi:hypothetical protein